MKRAILVMGIAFLCLAVVGLAGEPVPNLTGTWVLDAKNSDPFLRPIKNLGAPGMTGGMPGGMGGGFPGGGMGGGMPGGGMGGGMPGGMGGGLPGPGAGAKGPGAGAGGFKPPSETMVIHQTENEIEITRIIEANGKEMPIKEKYKLSEGEQINMVPVPNVADPVKMVTKVSWKKNKMKIHTTSFYPNNKTETKKEYSLSKDGKVLTVNTSSNSNASAMGELVQKQIYNRQ